MDAISITIIVLLIIILIICLYFILRNPFRYPYYKISFDITGKRNPTFENLIDSYLNNVGIDPFVRHFRYVEQWKLSCNQKIQCSKLKNLRRRQFNEVLADNRMFQFTTTRDQTRYRQQNYVKHAYKVTVSISRFSCDLNFLQNRYNQLQKIDFACTLSEYNAKDQRRLMTKALRDEIAERDNYTCKICGKYMPDGIGLHIDHIIPIAKGGKSIPSNLQVLCSKCNGRKSKN